MKRTWPLVGAAVLALTFLYLPILGVSGGQILVFLLVLLCPLMHLLGMHRHGGHANGDSRAPGPSLPGAGQVRAPDRET